MLDPLAKEGKDVSEPAALEQQPMDHLGCLPKEHKSAKDSTYLSHVALCG